MDEQRARGWLCQNAEALRSTAIAGGWRPRLDAALVDVVKGDGSALDTVTALLGAPPDDVSEGRGRHDADPHLLLGSVPTQLNGDYGCPRDWCPRRTGRDVRGRPPWCHLHQAPMRFRER
ncbi:hypothetical protein ACTMTJ_42540 [Phytohabitans sp. LJ34]|uniref:hypothetical protein n=1 Tax=Phytohabitans sp. LJ34 TaxID=3452217 RepID=UPI003F889A9D